MVPETLIPSDATKTWIDKSVLRLIRLSRYFPPSELHTILKTISKNRDVSSQNNVSTLYYLLKTTASKIDFPNNFITMLACLLLNRKFFSNDTSQSFFITVTILEEVTQKLQKAIHQTKQLIEYEVMQSASSLQKIHERLRIFSSDDLLQYVDVKQYIGSAYEEV